MNRAFSTLEIKAVDEAKRKFSGIASTPSTDRMGDIVEPKGAKFKLPLPLLWQHNSGDPIGWVTAAKVTDKGIEVEGEIADIPEEGPLKARLATAWQMLKNKLVRGLSIGFNSIESARIDGTYGIHFLNWEWLELSAVTIPANQDATITNIKAAFGRNLPGVPGITTKGSITMKTLQEQLAELREARTLKAARMSEIAESIEAGIADDAAGVEFDGLTADVAKLDGEIRVKTAQAVSASTAKAIPSTPQAPTILIRKADQDEKFAGQNYTRMVIAKALAQLEGVSPLVIAEKRWGKSNPLLVSLIKTAVAGGGSGSGEWGAELVQANTQYVGDFIEYLHGMTVFDKLALREVPANVAIKGQDGTATGYWVGQSKPIPVSKADFSTVSLSPLKVAALAVVSNELLRDSSPAAEQLVRDALAEASAQRVDTTFLGTGAASANVSPAGLLNGLVAGTSAGTDSAGLKADIKALYSGFITAKNASGLVLVMNPALAKAIQLMENTLGLPAFPGITQSGGTLMGDTVVTGDNVNAAHMILMKPSDIYKIGDGGVEVSISREAVIEMDDAPAGASDTPVGATGALVSMFQSESTAIKIVRSINYAKRRSTAVAYIGDADYGTETT